MEEKITYFETPGKQNTETTFRLAAERAEARGINKIILSSTRGDNARQAAIYFEGKHITLVVVPHQFGFGERQRFPVELVAELEKKGHKVYCSTMLFHTESFYGMNTPSVMATLLRTFCQGIKVCVETILMVTNGGLVAAGERVIAIAGTGGGADTAVVAIAAPSTRLNELHITEIICKPLETKSAPIGVRSQSPVQKQDSGKEQTPPQSQY